MNTAEMRSWHDVPSLIRDGGVSGVLLVTLLVILLGAWIKTIFPEWAGNPDLSHGFFTPLLFVLLLRESRSRGPYRFLPSGPILWSTMGVVLGLCLVVLLASALLATAMDWSHPLVMFLLGSGMTGALVAAWLFAASTPIRLVPFNWVAAVAIILWGASLPIPPGTYSELTLTLQLWVSDQVLRTLHLLGIPAIQNGNIIDLPRTSIGVEEACSGVRSLLSCIYAGLFFSAAFVRRWPSRLAIIILAPLLAIGMNFVRSLLLTLLAHGGVDISGTWHDATGFAILGVTAVVLGLLAISLEKFEGTPRRHPEPVDVPPSSRAALPGARLLTAGYTAAVACIALFVFLTRPVAVSHSAVPQILEFLPDSPAGWGTATSTGLNRFADILETDNLGQRTYVKKLPDGELLQVTFYMAYWKPGQAGINVVATHTPDACWPGAGWAPQPTEASAANLPLADRTLNRSEYRLFTNEEKTQHVWFWHSYDHRVITQLDPRRPAELIRSVFAYGVRSQGEQLFVRVSSNRPWADFDHEPLMTEIFEDLKPFGI